MRVNWNRQTASDVDPAPKRFDRWLTEHGYWEAYIELYLKPIRRFLKEEASSSPTLEDAKEWQGDLAEPKQARGTVNIWGAILKAFL